VSVIVCDVAEPALENFARTHPKADRAKADVSSEEDIDRLFHKVESRAGRPRRARKQCRHRWADRRCRGHRPRRMAPLHRCRPHRAISLRETRRASAQGGKRWSDRQHVVRRRPAWLRLSLPLFGREIRRHRFHAKPRQGARPPQTSASTPFCPESSKVPACEA